MQPVWIHGTSEGREPTSFERGADLVLHVPPAHGTQLPDGVLVDDHLSLAERVQIENRAQEALDAWTLQADRALTRRGVSLARVWKSELFAEIALPVMRIQSAVPRALEGLVPSSVRLGGIGTTRAAAVEATLASGPWSVSVDKPLQLDPLQAHFARRSFSFAGVPRWVVDSLGLPNMLRGDVLVVAYGTTVPVLERMTAGGSLRPAFHGAIPPGPALAFRSARQGGMTGRPGAVQRARSRRRTRPTLRRLEAMEFHFEVAGADVGPAIAGGAAQYLQRRGTETFAWADQIGRALKGSGVRAVLLPFDWDPVGGTVAAVAQSLGIPSLCLQHGYEPLKRYVPGGNSDLRGVWSSWDIEALVPADRARTRVVGDTRRGAVPSARSSSTARTDGPAVVLGQAQFRESSIIDSRMPARHIMSAAEAIRRVFPDTRVVFRPHPSADPEEMAALARLANVDFDRRTPLRVLLASARVCVGATSSGTLECALTGTPVVMLDLDSPGWTPPLDGSGTVPHATSTDELDAALRHLLDAPMKGHDELRHALGLGLTDPVTSVVEWLSELTAQPLGAASR